MYSVANKVTNIKEYGSPNLLYRNDSFLTTKEVKSYQDLLASKTWGVSSGGVENLMYISKDLYNHYAWDGNWDSPCWVANESTEWEDLYKRIAAHMPRHYLHWVDVKITSYGQTGTPRHRDKDPWTPGGDVNKFSRSLTVLCNLNTNWDSDWGGGFEVYKTDETGFTKTDTIPITPGQLLILENCTHSIQPITKIGKSRISVIIHALEYR